MTSKTTKPANAAPKTKTKTKAARAAPPTAAPAAGGKLAVLIGLLRGNDDATIPTMMEATGWQAHSVRGAMAGAIKKRGHRIVSAKAEGVRTYRIDEPAA